MSTFLFVQQTLNTSVLVFPLHFSIYTFLDKMCGMTMILKVHDKYYSKSLLPLKS